MATVGFVPESDGPIGSVEVDATIRENHTLSAQATEHPVEGSGQATTDHILQMPDVLVLDCVVSDTPVHVPTAQMGGAQPITRKVEIEVSEDLLPDTPFTPGLGPLNQIKRTSKVSVDFQDYTQPLQRRSNVWQELRRMKEAGELITVVTSLQAYTSMAIEEITTEVTASNGRALEFTITMRRVVTVDSVTVDVDLPASPPKAKGRQNTTPASAEQADRASASYTLFDSLGLLPGR